MSAGVQFIPDAPELPTPEGSHAYLHAQPYHLGQLAIDVIIHDPSRHHPVVLYGVPGAGKTHLLQIIKQGWIHHYPHGTWQFFSGADFARAFARSVESKKADRFRQSLLETGLLVIDSVHQLKGKTAAQELLRGLIDQRQPDLPVLLACRELPQDHVELHDRLRSRLAAGLLVKCEPPGAAALQYAAKQLRDELELQVDLDQLHAFVSQLDANLTIPQLRQALLQWQQSTDAATAKQSLPNAGTQGRTSSSPTADSSANAVSLDRITMLVARYFRISRKLLVGSQRKRTLVRARSLAMYLARQLTPLSFQRIGQYFGNRDHTTVIHACRQIEERVQQGDPEVRKAIDDLLDKLGQRV